MAQRNGDHNKGSKRHAPYWKDKQARAKTEKHEKDGDSEKATSSAAVEEKKLNDTGSNGDGRKKEKKYANRARLFVGNLPKSMTEEELLDLFRPFGESPQAHIEKDKSFGFVRMPYRIDAEKAISALNGSMYNGRELRVRIAASSCSVKVSNIHPMVSNELLADAFSQFGEVEHAVIVTDERGNSKEYGIVDFAKKSHAIQAIQVCSQRFFVLTRSPMPVVVSEITRDNEEGLPDKLLQKNSAYALERDSAPRFATPGTPEFDMASRWCAVYDNEKARRDELEAQLKEARNQLRQEMEKFNRHDFMQEHTMQLRAQLAHHQEEQARLAEEIRRQEDKLHGYQSSYHSPSSHHHHMGGGGGYHLPPPPPPPPPPAPPQPLFSSGQSTGNMPRQEHPKTILPNPPGPPQGGGLMPPPFMPPFHPGIGSRYPPQ